MLPFLLQRLPNNIVSQLLIKRGELEHLRYPETPNLHIRGKKGGGEGGKI